MIAALLLTARRRGLCGVSRLCGGALYLAMRLRHRRLPRAAVARATRTGATVSPGSVDTVRIAGVTWSIPSDDRKPGSLPDRVLRRDLPLADILRTRTFARGGVMIDIGANIGATSITRVLLGDVDRAYGVEPDPASFDCLRRTIRDNGLEDHVIVDRVALGSTDGEADQLVAGRIARLVASGAARPSTIRVPTMRLDTWTQRLGADLDRVRYVKCDTQGWEAHVVAGATALLARRSIRWEMEICPGLLDAAGSSVDELCAMLAPHFEWFVDLRADDETLDRRATVELAAAVQAAVAGGKNYTNVILSN
jgi:FkbM family methyltransferase